MFGQGFNYGFLGKPLCFTDTTDIFKDNSGVALYTLDYDGSDAGGASGNFGESAVLTGTSSQINFPNIPLSAFDAAAVSVSLWVNMQAVTSGYSSGSYVFRGRGNWIIQVTSSGIEFQKYDTGPGNNGNNDLSYNFSGGTNLNQWYHIVVTDNGTSTSGLNLYVDGVLRDSNSGYANIDDNSWLAGIANYAGRAGGNFKVDQLRIFNKEISSSEVTTLYNETKNTTNTLQVLGDTSCIATYTFDGSSTDLSGNYNGTDTNILYKYDGTPSNVDFGVEGKINYGARFKDATDSFISTSLLFTGTGAKSFSFWFKANSVSSANSAFYFSNNGGRIDVHIAGTGSNTPSANYQTVSINSTTAITGWNFVTLVFSGWLSSYSSYSYHGPAITCKVYLNGGSVQTVSPLPYNGSKELHLGGLSGNSSNYDGKLDQFRVFNKELSTDEIDTLYAETACVYTSTTDNIALPITNTAYYKLDNDSKDSARSTGKFNEGAIFNGSSSKIATGLTLPADSTMSFSFWLKSASNSSGNNYFLSDFDSSGSNNSSRLSLAVSTNNGFRIWISNGSSNWNSTDDIDLSSYIDLWTNLVVVLNGTDIKVYINGGTPTTLTSTVAFGTAGSRQQYIGGVGGNNGASYEGSIDQVRIYDVALSSADVSNLYAETASDTNTLSFPSGQTATATYQLDGNSTDLSGNYNGTDTNITYAYNGTDTNIEYRFGRFGQAAVFNGTDSKIDTGAAIVSNQSAFSFSAWVNFDNLSTHNMIISNSESSGNGQLMMYGWTDGNIYFQPDSTSSSNRGYLSTSGLMTTNQWVHIVMVFDGSATGNSNRLKVYIQGEEKTLTYGGTIPSSTGTVTNNTYIGGRGSQSHSFHGAIDQVRIYDAALTSNQVTKLYNEKPEVDTSNFNAVLYTGTGASQYISNVGFQPDLVWIKQRNGSASHSLQDTVRGAGQSKNIYSDNTAAEGTYGQYGYLSSFDTNGFTVEAGSGSHTNANGSTYVSWCWKGGGAAVSNTDGTITTQVSANVDAGFSIVQYTAAGNQSFGHGLSQAPELIIQKLYSTTSGWYVYSAPTGLQKYLQLNSTAALGGPDSTWITAVTNATFTANWSGNSHSYINYCFHSVAGYSKIGSYTGVTGNKTVTTGFRPSFIIIKNTSTAGNNWNIMDSRRDTSNPIELNLWADTADTESTASQSNVYDVDFDINGFTIKNNFTPFNANGEEYLYMAFK